MPIPTPLHEPHKIKTVRLIAFPSLEERKRNLSRAHFNVFNLTPSQVGFDMASYGTSAMSQEQVAGQLLGDEAYAGATNFETLVETVTRVLGHTYVCPTHNSLGAVKLLVATLTPPGSLFPSNARARIDLHAPRGIEIADLRDRAEPVFTGNFDLARLEALLGERRAAIVGMQCFADGQHPFSLANLRAVRALADRHGLRLVLDVSRVIENAWYVQRHEAGQADRTIAELVKLIAKTAHVILLDGGQDAKANTGGLLATDNPADHQRFLDEVVVYEGLHTYGGMAGRTMEVLARGLAEMADEHEVQWVMHQTERFTARLREAGVPLERGCDGAYLRADEILPQVREYPEHALASALYQSSGVRVVVPGTVGRDHLLPVQIPRLAMTNWQLDQVADAIVALFRQRERVAALDLEAGGLWHDQLRFRSVLADLATYEFDCFPFVVHTTEPIARTTREQREQAVRAAGWNTFLLRSADVTIDLLTDSGTTAMSTDQWAAYDAATATPATSEAYLRFVAALQEIYGYQYILPTHQGRAAEQIQSEVLIRPGQLVPGNMYFTTTKVHQELAGGTFVDVIVDEAHDPASEHPWKGNVDLAKLDALVQEHGAEKVAYLSFELSVNMAGGQPVSMDNLREVYAYCRPKGIPVLFDATRAVENAYFIQKRDPRYAKSSIRAILREIMAHGDGCTVSGKKDFLINIGGLLALQGQRRLGPRRRGEAAPLRGRRARRRAARGRPGRHGARRRGDARRPLHPHARRAGRLAGRPPERRRRAGGGPHGQPRGLHRRQALPAARRPGRVPGPAPGGRDLPGDGRARHGARQRLEGPPARRPELPPGPGAGAPDPPAPGLLERAHEGRGGRHRPAVPAPAGDPGPALRAGAAHAALLPGTLRAHRLSGAARAGGAGCLRAAAPLPHRARRGRAGGSQPVEVPPRTDSARAGAGRGQAKARPDRAQRWIPPLGGAAGAHLRRGRPGLSLLPGPHEAGRHRQRARPHRPLPGCAGRGDRSAAPLPGPWPAVLEEPRPAPPGAGRRGGPRQPRQRRRRADAGAAGARAPGRRGLPVARNRRRGTAADSGAATSQTASQAPSRLRARPADR